MHVNFPKLFSQTRVCVILCLYYFQTTSQIPLYCDTLVPSKSLSIQLCMSYQTKWDSGHTICFFEHRGRSSQYFFNRPIHVFKITTNTVFQRTIIQAVSQDTTMSLSVSLPEGPVFFSHRSITIFAQACRNPLIWRPSLLSPASTAGHCGTAG